MTISVAIKIHDGVVLASDSASTLTGVYENTVYVRNIYNNGNKIFNLYKGLPIGAITWGLGNIGPASIATLAKDFRQLISTPGGAWEINKSNYSMKEVVDKFQQFFFIDKYQKEVAEPSAGTDIGFYLAGYSSDAPLAEIWLLRTENGQVMNPEIVLSSDQTAALWNGDPEAITRLYLGYSTYLPEILKMANIPDAKMNEIMNLCQQHLKTPFIEPPMPIQDAIDLASFLVETTIRFKKFGPGHNTVGGPIEIAAITKHEGFKWIKRKYYFEDSLNPES